MAQRRHGISARHRITLWGAALLVAVSVMLGTVGVTVQVLATAPLPAVGPPAQFVMSVSTPSMPWPPESEAEVIVPGVAVYGPVGSPAPVPIASVAKIMTAYVILRDHPLNANESGPSIPITPSDVAAFRFDAEQGDSVVPVVAGHSLTEREALQALLIRSGDNIADLMATWDAGSANAFVAKMNAAAKAIGMDNTHYADASGLSDNTVSTASNQLILAPLAMAEPSFAQTVSSPTAVLPEAGLVLNYNTLLGSDGITGIKTGSTWAAGGCMVFSALHGVRGHTVTIYGAILGVVPAPGQSLLAASLVATQRLVVATEAKLKPRLP